MLYTGTDWKVFTHLNSRPDAPIIVDVFTSMNNEATVQFTEPMSTGGYPITSYTATSSPGGFSATVSDLGNITVAGLTNFETYTFTVTATNAMGTSVASVASDPVIPAANAPDAPTLLSVIAGNANAIVSFEAPHTDGGSPITSYTVTSSPGGFSETVSQSEGGSIKVTGLTNGTEYRFAITAINAVGPSESALSNPVTPATIPGPPTGVTATAGNASATVSFSAPLSNGGFTITSYTVTSSDGQTVSVTQSKSATVTGLTNGSDYTFTVKANSSFGTSTLSAPSNSVTPATTPDAPTIDSVITTAGVGGSATITYTAPLSNGGSTITSYTATSDPDGITATVNQSGSGIISVTGLTIGSTYKFEVTANNAKGTSTASGLSTSVISSVQIGDNYQGGIVFYLEGTGSSGLVCEPEESTQNLKHPDALEYCKNLTNADTGTGIYNDWVLPSLDNLRLMYLKLQRYGCSTNYPSYDNTLCDTRIGNFSSDIYWSSQTEWFGFDQYCKGMNFSRGNSGPFYPYTYNKVRAVRAF